MNYTIEVLNLLAIAYHSQGKTDRSMQLLRKSLQLGEQEEYIRINVEEGTIMDVLLGRFVRWNIVNAQNENGLVSLLYVRKIMKLTREYSLIIMSYVKENGVIGKNTQTWNISLTKRELDVLQLLTTELSNAEIACALDVTLNTVKVHSSSLYRKLGAKNREQATQRARELNILE